MRQLRKALVTLVVIVALFVLFRWIDALQAQECREHGGEWRRTGITAGCNGDGRGFF
jgi:hypothetical protein